MASPLFNGLHAFFQLQHFGIEHAVALEQALVFGMLLGNLLLQLGHLRQAAITHPQAVLQATQQQEQDEEQPIGTAHHVIQVKKAAGYFLLRGLE
ncbi:hypothetical protein D3C78_1407780 [compost metagenome]